MNSKLFDLEHLQQLTYERSKTWASFLDNAAKNETLVEIDIDNLEELYDPECDENDTHEELASMEDEEFEEDPLDSDVLKNVTNISRFSLLFNKKSLALPQNDKNEENNKLLDIFNQTMPIINEHNRQLKESGFERILSTFDKQKIEDKVGSWLNRHNSLYGGDNTLLYTVSQEKKKDYKGEFQISTATRSGARISKPCKNRATSNKDRSHDSDDSLQSGETARYIRSSKAGAIKNSSATTTMIKTYRMVKSTREALREKYACEKAEDEYHLKSLRHRRRFLNELEYHHNHYDLARLQKSRKHEMPQPLPSSSHKVRRKVLRKRSYSNSCSTMDSSSDSDYYNEEDHRSHRKHLPACCNQYYCTSAHNKFTPQSSSKDVVKRESQRSAIKMPSSRMNRIYYYTHSQTKSFSSSSSSSASFSSMCDRRRVMKRNDKFFSDNRPCRRESECHCCNERKLCEDYKHVADSSTEEWYVENCRSPKKYLQASVPHLKSNLEKVDEVVNLSKQNIKIKNTKQPPNKNSKQKPNTTKTKFTSNSANNSEDETFDLELQMAIKASKELYKKEQEIKMTTNKKEKHEILPTKPLRKATKNTIKNQVEEIEPNETTRKRQNTKNRIQDIDKEDQIMEKQPKLIEEKNDLKAKVIISNDDEQIFIKPKLKSPKVTAIKNKDSSITTTREETFFSPTHTQVICNSTAVSSKSQAFNRQITDEMCSLEDVSKYEIDKKKSTTNENKTKKSTEKSLLTTKKKATSSTTAEKKVSTKKATASTTVTSTTIRSPEINSTLSSRKNRKMPEDETDELSDCTLVTSTTNIELLTSTPPTLTEEEKLIENDTINSNHQITQKGILIYAPHNRSMVPANSFTSDGYFTITKEHLSGVIGEKPAEKFLKYYIGRKRFKSNSTIYFRPPIAATLDGNISSSSDSDDDLDNLGQYGDLYESIGNASEISK